MLSANNSKTESHILEPGLIVSPEQERILLVRLNCARELYNACLSEDLKRLGLMRESTDFKSALKQKGWARAAAFKDLNKRLGFREYDLHAFAAKTRNACHIGDHPDSQAPRKVASRAFHAVEQVQSAIQRKCCREASSRVLPD
jgi:hypothetical protein